jgi:hypothetical protein
MSDGYQLVIVASRFCIVVIDVVFLSRTLLSIHYDGIRQILEFRLIYYIFWSDFLWSLIQIVETFAAFFNTHTWLFNILGYMQLNALNSSITFSVIVAYCGR